jgi:hypothetical protein
MRTYVCVHMYEHASNKEKSTKVLNILLRSEQQYNNSLFEWKKI